MKMKIKIIVEGNNSTYRKIVNVARPQVRKGGEMIKFFENDYKYVVKSENYDVFIVSEKLIKEAVDVIITEETRKDQSENALNVHIEDRLNELMREVKEEVESVKSTVHLIKVNVEEDL